MNEPAAHTRPWQIAEVILAAAILLSILLGLIIPLPLNRLVPRPVSIAAGALLLLAGLLIISNARRAFRQAGQPTDPGRPTTRLITTGPFAWSRNPLYLGGLAFLAGLAALFGSLWLLILLGPAAAALHFVLIVPEERYLERQFGAAYRAYAASVSRWLGRKRPNPR